MTNEERWTTFINELREYIQLHHHLPDKHKVENRGLLNQPKYTRKKTKDGTLDVEKAKGKILNMRNMSEHTGGRKKLYKK